MLDSVFVINLSRRTDKRAHMEKELEKLHRHNINTTFFPAIDGADDAMLSLFQYTTAEWSDPNTHKAMTKGEVGCALSHYSIWKQVSDLVDDGTMLPTSQVLILEDDVILDDNFVELFNNYTADQEYDMLYVHRKPFNLTSEEIVTPRLRVAKMSYWLCAYVITGRCAKLLTSTDYLNQLIPVDEYVPIMYGCQQVPHYLQYQNDEKIRCYACVPSLARLTSNAFNDSETYHSNPIESSNETCVINYVGPTDTDSYRRFVEYAAIYGHDVRPNMNYNDVSSHYILEIEVYIDDCYILPQLSPAEMINYYRQHCGDDIVVTNLANDISFKFGRAAYFNQSAPTVTLDFNFFYRLSDDYHINHYKSTVTQNNVLPCMIYGTNTEYLQLNHIGNYIGNGWNAYYGYKKPLTDLQSLPTIYVSVRTSDNTRNLELVRKFNYPSELLTVVEDASDDSTYYQHALAKFLESDCQYYFYVDTESCLDNPDVLTKLLLADRDIVAPFIRRGQELWTNFWGSVTSNGFYKRSTDYVDIVNGDRRGVWNVPYISYTYLVKRSVIERFPNLYRGDGNRDCDLSFCDNLRQQRVFMYVDNTEVYGRIYKDVTLFDVTDDKYAAEWEQKYFHPEFSANIDDLAKVNYTEISDGIYTFPLFSETFCRELIALVEKTGKWSLGKDNHHDPRIGKNYYENVPTVDSQLFDVGLDAQWKHIVSKYISRVASVLYCRYKTKGVNLAFVVRYNSQDQSSLSPHHDSSTYTVNIALNAGGGVEYSGGGCRFIRQDISLVNQPVGMCCIHPGRLTAYHEGLATTGGTRYILVSFIN